MNENTMDFGTLIQYIELNKDIIPPDAKIYIERVEDEYFKTGGWKPVKLDEDVWFERGNHNQEKGDWIEAYEMFYNKKENVVKITPHY